MYDRPRPPSPPRMDGGCGEPLPESLYPDGCNAQMQTCGRVAGHDGDHRAWVQMAPVIVDWPLVAEIRRLKETT